MLFASNAPVTAAVKHKTAKAPAPSISTVHLTIIGIFIPIILVAINATTAAGITEAMGWLLAKEFDEGLL